MLSSDTFSYTVQARCTLAEAAAMLSDLTRQGELHPLIVRVRQLPPRPGAQASYTINDRLVAGPLRFRTTYHADVLSSGNDEIIMVARQWPATTVHNRTRLRAEPDGLVRIDVEITLTAPTPLFRYAFRQARAAHLALAARLGPALSRTNNPPLSA
ncbi:SRPBCC family protein [Micromonospora sp. NPDC048935]|uniref:SRPBCC family protein n=1 Tax=Micromonospora sp. NPDC048935 TaxID=3364262 RepID=UPI003721F2B3